MKQYINHKLYDTTRSTAIGGYEYGGASDLDHRCETLYRKRTGEYFLHGSGGAMSRYAVLSGANTWSGGEKIIPLTFDQAREWSENHLSTAEYDAQFGEILDDGSAEIITFNLNSALVEQARRAQRERQIASLSALVEDALRAYLT